MRRVRLRGFRARLRGRSRFHVIVFVCVTFLLPCGAPAQAPHVSAVPTPPHIAAQIAANVATAAATNVTSHPRTLPGIDVLENENFRPLRGKRVGLITNQTGMDSHHRSTIDVLAHAPGVKLVALFSPEHGIRGELDSAVPSETDSATHLPIFSLFGKTVRPTPEMLAGIDALVFDIQDAGVRFYTYITTMGYAMEAAAAHHLTFYVLDRPDPLGGERVEGPMLDRDKLNFTGYFPMPVRMAMTLGEMAQMFNAENHLNCDLHVIAMKTWRRAYRFEDTGLTWIRPSPNLPSLDAAAFYPGLEILQSAGVSVGRGTSHPFEMLGAPWIASADAAALAARLTALSLPGVKFAAIEFTPSSGIHAGNRCIGLALTVTRRADIAPMRIGLEIAAALAQLYPAQFDVSRIVALTGNAETITRLQSGVSPSAIIASWSSELAAFNAIRAKYLMYP